MDPLGILILLAVGALLAVQTAANVQLSAAMHSPFGASTLQLSIGAVLLLAAAVVGGTVASLELVPEAPAWHLLGGLGSALYISAGILLFPRLGALVAVGLFIAGQMAASLVLDATGWLGVPREPADAVAVAGAAAVVAGTVLIVRAQAGRGALDAAVRGRRGWIVLGLVAGAALPVQGAVNGRLQAGLDAPLATGAVSFVVAAVAMAAVLGATLALARAARPRVAPLRGVPWWGWLGGLVGATYVTAVFSLIPEIGTAPTIALTVAGQQVASVLVDRHGLLRLPRRDVPRARLAGVAILLGGVALVQLA